jgi:hypothetical protein
VSPRRASAEHRATALSANQAGVRYRPCGNLALRFGGSFLTSGIAGLFRLGRSRRVMNDSPPRRRATAARAAVVASALPELA